MAGTAANNDLINKLKQELRVDESFDLIAREIEISGKRACLFFIDGLLKDEVMEKIMEFFYSVKDQKALNSANLFAKMCVPYVEVDVTKDMDKLITAVLSGTLAFVVEGFEKAILIDSRTYPQRETAEPEKDKAIRGSKDGFVETLISNTALIRRRIRTPQFTIKAFNAGSLSKTDIAVCYLENKVDKKLLKEICLRIENIDTEDLTMNKESFIEQIYKNKWYNPFPKVKYTERPDTAASAVYDGNIVIIVDNSPSAIILPTSIFDILEEVEDYYFPPITGTYLRVIRNLVAIGSLFITPVWLLLLQHQNIISGNFAFLIPDSNINIPIFWQLIILELVLDGLRLASLHTPTSITTTLSIIGGIVLSDFAVQSGWFNTETMLYMAFVAISNYAGQSLELGYAIKFLRILLLVLTELFSLWGFIIGFIVIVFLLVSNKTVSGKSYLYPLIPFNYEKLKWILVRRRV